LAHEQETENKAFVMDPPSFLTLDGMDQAVEEVIGAVLAVRIDGAEEIVLLIGEMKDKARFLEGIELKWEEWHCVVIIVGIERIVLSSKYCTS
jgi:hypothetical protein